MNNILLKQMVFNDFYKMVERVFSESRLPFKFSKYSNGMYNNFVHVFLLVLKEKYKQSYRGLVELADSLNIRQMLGLIKVPHFTTLQKFISRLDKDLLAKLVRVCGKILNLTNIKSAIDGTGFDNTHPSMYYQNKYGVNKGYKNYVNTHILTDLYTKLVINIETCDHRKHDSQFFIPLIEPLKQQLSCVLADRGYDSMELREFCWNNNITNHIDFRCFGKVSTNKKRSDAKKRFRRNVYHKRSIVESVISAVKRRFGDFVTSRKKDNQQKQVILKVLAYNITILSKYKQKVFCLWVFILK
jgi:transposase